jgi:hypothetical protein
MKGLDKYARGKEIETKLMEIFRQPWAEPMLLKDIAMQVGTSYTTAKSHMMGMIIDKRIEGIKIKKVGTTILLMKN